MIKSSWIFYTKKTGHKFIVNIPSCFFTLRGYYIIYLCGIPDLTPLPSIIDDATRWAFVWSYGKADAENTEDFVRRVIERAPFTIQKIRTDQGTEFVNRRLQRLLAEHHIEYRKNTPYCPEENGKIERFHGTLNQKAFCYGFPTNQTLDQMQYRLNLFMHYYNYQKKQRGLGMDGKTPIEKLNDLASVNLTLQCHIT